MRGGIVGNGVGSGREDFMPLQSGILKYFPLGIGSLHYLLSIYSRLFP